MLISEKIRVVELPLEERGNFPNNPVLPVLIYRGCFPSLVRHELEGAFRDEFESNGWAGCWKGDVYTFHHFHSNTHEILGVCAGSVLLELGGPQGHRLELRIGDAVLLPAGTAHRKEESDEDFAVIGAYPGGVKWNLRFGEADERDRDLQMITSVPRPTLDPLLGDNGGAVQLWADLDELDASRGT